MSRVAVLDSGILAIACLITFMLARDVLTRVYHLSQADDLIGGLWAVIATVFVFRDTYQHSVSASVTRIAAITFANGADTISVFTPLFRTLHTAGSLLAAALFLALTALWCAAGALLGSHQAVIAALGRTTHWLVPAVFIAVGLLILITSGTLTTINHAG